MPVPPIVVFDVDETLSDFAPLRKCFAELGAPQDLVSAWLPSVQRDGLALTLNEAHAPFRRRAEDVTRSLLAAVPLGRSIDEAVASVWDTYEHLPAREDVVPCVRALSAAGFRLVTLGIGPEESASRLLESAGVRDCFERLLSTDRPNLAKPSHHAYDFAAGCCDAFPEEMLLVTVHPWDIHGAHKVGLETAWVNREDRPYPASFGEPDHAVRNLGDLAEWLT